VLGDSRTQYTDTRYLLEARYEPKINDVVQLFFRAHANRYTFDGDYVNQDPNNPANPHPPQADVQHEDYVGMWFGGEARVVITPIKQIRLTAGGEGQGAPTADMVGNFPAAKPPGNADYLNTHNPYGFGAGYVVLEATPVPWLRLSAGARADDYTTFGPVFVPRGAVIFKTPKGGTLKLMAGRAFRAPSIYEQFYTDGGVTQLPGDDAKHHLAPESIVSTEVEFSQRFLRDWLALAAGHFSRVDNYIETLPDAQQPSLLRYVNTPNPVLVAGLDLELRREWRQGWMVSAMYGYQRVQRYDFGESGLPAITGNPRLSNAPEHLASFKGVVPVLPDLVSLATRITLEAPRLDEYGQTTATHVIADLAVSGTLKRFGVSYAFGVYNVLDQRYDYPVSISYLSSTMQQNGRTFLGDLKVAYP
jgi:outer membrane receptor protein involved in Fe transport